jgi:UDP-N-acetylmuramoyl-L-alanyl-D-glutamate--2,6-diaminopimelate ligase
MTFCSASIAENALAAAGAAMSAGVEAGAVKRALAEGQPAQGRFEVLSRSPAVVLDYAHSPDALARTCRTARAIVGAGRLIVVFGAGGGADPEKRGPMGAAVSAVADEVFVTNDNPRQEPPQAIADALIAGTSGKAAKVHCLLDRAAAIERAIQLAGPADLVLVAGRGRETGMVIGSESLPYSDALEIERVLGSAKPKYSGEA